MTDLLPYKNLFYTRGKYYTYISQEEMNGAIPEGLKYNLGDLKEGEVYTFFRAVLDVQTDERKYVRLTGKVEAVYPDLEMFIYSHHGEELKLMKTEGYKDHWVFVPGPVSKESIYVN